MKSKPGLWTCFILQLLAPHRAQLHATKSTTQARKVHTIACISKPKSCCLESLQVRTKKWGFGMLGFGVRSLGAVLHRLQQPLEGELAALAVVALVLRELRARDGAARVLVRVQVLQCLLEGGRRVQPLGLRVQRARVRVERLGEGLQPLALTPRTGWAAPAAEADAALRCAVLLCCADVLLCVAALRGAVPAK